MIGLALAGGGVKGSYQIGAYYAFKKCHIKFDGIVGTSIGAFNGAMIAAHKEKELLAFWQNADSGKLLNMDPKWVEKIKEEKFDFDFWQLSFKEMKRFLTNKGISIDNLQDFLESYHLEEALKKSNIEFGLSTYRFKDHKPLDIFFSGMRPGSVNNYIMSSCYLPIFKREKLEDDSYYFDGGIYNYAPYNMLLKKEYDKVYSIELKAIGIKQIPLDTSKVIIISPSRRLSSMISINEKAIRENIAIGYYDTLKVLKNYDGYKFIFKKKDSHFFNKLNSNIKKDEYRLIKSFLGAKSDKEMIIKATEYLMKKSNMTYYKVYSLPKMIRHLRKREDDSIMSKYLRHLNLL